MADQTGTGAGAPERVAPAQVARTPRDLPTQRIISGTGKNAQIRLTAAQSEQFVVLEAADIAYIVAEESLYGKSESTAIFQEVRSRLPSKFSDVKVLWATRGLIEQLGRLKSDGAASGEGAASGNSEAAALFRQWVDYALEERASDIHLEVRREMAGVRFRIDGALETMRGEHAGEYIAALAQGTAAYVYNKMTDKRSTSNSQFQANKHMYSMVSYGEGDDAIKLRCQTVSLVNGFDLIMRVLRTESGKEKLSYGQLGYVASQSKLIEDATVTLRGLVLVSGITGSGKTTTLKSIMQSIPGRDQMKLVSIEDPVEYIIDGVSHTALQRDVSDESESVKVFNEAVKSWLRGDPDVMMIGELRDASSGIAALSEAETGHMALATVHANNAVGIIQRLVSPAIGMDLHALTAPNILSLLIYQALVPVLCKDCKIPIEQMGQEVCAQFHKVAVKFNVDVWNMFFRNPQGCPCCKGRGTKGMTVVAEIIKPDRTFLSLMRERREFDAIDYWLATGDGMYDTEDMTGKTVFHHAFYLALQGIIDPNTPERFERYEHVELVADRLTKSKAGAGARPA